MKKILSLVGLVLACAVAQADVMYWTVSEADKSGIDYDYAFLRADDGVSTFGSGVEKGSATEVIASLGSDYAGKSFFIELTKHNSEDDTFSPVGISDILTASALEHFTQVNPSDLHPVWNGGSFHAVPEPTSGLLMLLGLAGLALKRKRA